MAPILTSSLPFASTITKPSALVVFTTSDVLKTNSSHNSTSRLHAVLCTYALNLSLKIYIAFTIVMYLHLMCGIKDKSFEVVLKD